MTAPIKLLLGLFAVALLGVGVMMYVGDPTQGDPIDNGEQETTDPQTGSKETEHKGDATKRAKSGKRGPIRVKTEDTTNSGSQHAQGISAQVIDEHGTPVPNARVYLMPGLQFDSLRMFQQYQQGVRFAPVARTVTDDNGRFKVGVREYSERKSYDLRVLHEDFCDAIVPGLQFQPNDWLEREKAITLSRGVALFGQVTNTNGVPIPGAKVAVKDGSGQLNITPPPGREDGLVAVAGDNGDYEIKNLDPKKIFLVNVSAQGFATEEKSNLNLMVGNRHQVDFKLTEGLEIGGRVLGPGGKPMPRAKVTVSALSQTSQQTEVAITDNDGSFLTPGLKKGIFSVLVERDGFLSAEEKPIEAGNTALTIQLEKTGAVLVTALGKDGRPLSTFHCNIRAAFEGSDTFGNPAVRQPVRGAKDGKAVVEGLMPMTYVAEVMAKGYAKNYSDRFTISPGQAEPPHVTVQLESGGTIFGLVRDQNGKPIRGVRVETRPNRMIDNPLSAMFQISYTVTQTHTTTNAKGEFRIEQLYGATYQLKLTHDDMCVMRIDDVAVQNDQITTIDNIKMTRGCLVTGLAMFDGQPTGQIQLTVSSISEDNKPVSFTCDAVSDNEGRFLITKRLPPGKYQVMGAQGDHANAIEKMVQYNKSKQEFLIRPGQESHQLELRVEPVK